MRHTHLILLSIIMLMAGALACGSDPTPTEYNPSPADDSQTEFTEPPPTEPPNPGPTSITITSDPSGAKVMLGIQSVGGVYDVTTGRHVGYTPLTSAIQESDVAYTNGNANLVIEISLDYYFPTMQIVALGSSLEPGKQYEVHVTLNPLN